MTASPVATAAPVRTVPALVERENQRRHHRRWLWSIVAALTIAAIGLGWLLLRPRPLAFAARFRTELSSRGDIVREVHATGHVEAVATVVVGAEISGRIASVTADFNDQVHAGDVLATFDRAALEAQSAQVLANVLAGRAALEQANVDEAQALRELERTTHLVAANARPTADLDDAQSVARLARKRVEAAEAQVAAQRAAHQLSRINLAHAVIRAPIDGVIITRNVDPGQTVVSALQTPVLFELAADLRKMRVIASVDEADIGELAVGQEATFTVDAYPERVFTGRVTEVRNSPVVVQEVVTYGTVVEVDNLELLLKPGMTAPVRLVTGRAHDVLRVPTSALSFVAPDEPKPVGAGVWAVDASRLRRLALTVGLSDGELTEVVRGDALLVDAPIAVELSSEGRRYYGKRR